MRRTLTATLSCVLSTLLAAPIAAQQFGGPLAVSGDQVLVGEAGNQTLSGIVYVFGETNGRWAEIDQIRVTDVDRAPDGFGQAIAADATTLVAGAPIEAAAYVFERSGGASWGEPTRVSGPAESDFGAAVALTERHMIVSAPAEGPGVVYVYDRSAPANPTRLAAPDGESGPFGARIATDGVHLLVATTRPRGAAGSVYTYALDGLEPLGQLRASGRSAGLSHFRPVRREQASSRPRDVVDEQRLCGARSRSPGRRDRRG